MDFQFTPQEEVFRQDLRAWLAHHLPANYHPDSFAWEMDIEERFQFHMAWHQQLHAGGWVGIHWPKEYGGRGATLIEQLIFHEELERARSASCQRAGTDYGWTGDYALGH
jgi:alkylation response protein AidB-like acyl-CoA dehydrogenase